MPISQNNHNNNQPIGVFDSGVGGLSILTEIKKVLPYENFVFLADQLYVPYGEKSKKELVARCLKISDYFIKDHNIKMLVVACNTATAKTIHALRKKHLVPIVGTIPAIKIAAQNSKSKVITVLSSPSTSKSVALKKLIKAYCKNIKVLNIGGKNLVSFVEEGKLNSKEVKNLLQKYLKVVVDSDADYLVLGCTHYPFLKKSIQKIVGSRVKLLDSGKAIARHTKSLLESNSLKNKTNKKGKTLYFTTGQSRKFSKVGSTLLKTKIQAKSIKL